MDKYFYNAKSKPKNVLTLHQQKHIKIIKQLRSEDLFTLLIYYKGLFILYFILI